MTSFLRLTKRFNAPSSAQQAQQVGLGMKITPRPIVIILVLLAMHVVVPSAAAHPLGNFTINHHAGLNVRRDAIVITYVLDMAEIPAFQEILSLDANRDGITESDETIAYHSVKCETILPRLELRMDDNPIRLNLQWSTIEFPPGVGGLATLRLTCVFSAPLSSPRELTRVEFRNDAYAERQGWREIVVNGEGVWLAGDFSSTSVSKLLRTYPDNLLTSPLDQREISFELALTSSVATQLAQTAGPDNTPPSGGRETSIVPTEMVRGAGSAAVLFFMILAITLGSLYLIKRRRNA